RSSYGRFQQEVSSCARYRCQLCRRHDGPCCGPTILDDPGREVAPGVRVVQHGKGDSMIPGYKTVLMRDLVYQPKAKSSILQANPCICHCPEGELRVKQSNGHEFTAKAGDVWACNKGLGEEVENVGAGVAVRRVIDLLAT